MLFLAYGKKATSCTVQDEWPRLVRNLAIRKVFRCCRYFGEPGAALALQALDDEPRILDVALAQHLGMADLHKVRSLIRANLDELSSFGEVSARRAETGLRGGRPGTAYYLNREQALLICILSRTERAKQVRALPARVDEALTKT